MKQFLDENFMINNETGLELYESAAKDMPIVDYHCHISPQEIWDDLRYENITQIWLYGDHYKWRAMRINGIPEEYITGDKSDYDKFYAWAKTIQNSIGNPLYHWSHMELKKYFGITKTLTPDTAKEIWDEANAIIKSKEFSVRNLIKKSNVKIIGTTDDPVDSLEYHIKLKEDKSFETKVVPAFRPDKFLKIEKETFIPWMKKLEKVADKEIRDITTLKEEMTQRIDFFHETGCRIADHGIDKVIFNFITEEEADVILKKRLNGEKLTEKEAEGYWTHMSIFYGKEYAKRNWIMQLHIGATRNNNTRMYKMLGADTGFDSINDGFVAENLSSLLDALDKTDELPKTILYNLNPRDNYIMSTMIGNFQRSGIPGKIQYGSGWWFNDNKEGMEAQMKALSNVAVLAVFIGMTTDSRSFLSYTRHDYFRRILCNLIGKWVEEGEYPYDKKHLQQMVRNISYNNAAEYFSIE